MSDRTDPEVRKLAEEILRLAGPTTHLNYPAQLDDAERRLLAFQSQREAALQGQRDRAERDSQRLRERNLILEDEVAALRAELQKGGESG